MTTAITKTAEQDTRRRRTVAWVAGLGFLGLVFDGYDLVVYGTVLPIFLDDPTQIGPVTPAVGGALGSYALVGVLVGALLAGTVSDVLGRRKLMLLAYGWFAVGMGVTAFSQSTTVFGLMRFLTGLGIGCLLATTAALVSEYAPPGKKNLYNALTYSGIAVGSTLSALLAIFLLPAIGWRGMFFIGALPLVTLLPLAVVKLPESSVWLQARGRLEEARALAERTGVPLSEAPAVAATSDRRERVGFAGLFSGANALPAILLGFMSVTGLVLVYALNTWLPELMGRAGFTTKGSLAFLLVLNGAAVVGQLIGSRLADRWGPKPVVAGFFLLGAVAIALLTLSLPLGFLLLFVALAGVGTSGTQTLVYGFVANYFRTNVRGAAVAWCAGFGRLGGIGGPLLGGLLVGAGLALNSIFLILAGIALAGVVLTLLVPTRRAHELHPTVVEPSATTPGVAQAAQLGR
ncbi:MFS transporter, AAHS family, benzoate transport protein [Geodermatophilus siccatus]|uniref:MFS transporter, AAHS family, benzoate transport protein n=1 Tax=Geodermatophilus siccatus TaxID=1137991 RepID=A0A1G9QKN8_9ACTN|nr:MFS transporter [Geodermatophilus siccatus]SDM11593.1 MFS transporter, AAHS family, benzoate transport protein [Geodermatophilus siccatus]